MALKSVFKVDRKTGKFVETTPLDVKKLVKLARKHRARTTRTRLAEGSSRRIRSRARWPIHSEAMGINVEDVPRAQRILAEKGVTTEYDGKGNPILRSAKHRKAHAEALGFFDRNGGYGDPQRKNG